MDAWIRDGGDTFGRLPHLRRKLFVRQWRQAMAFPFPLDYFTELADVFRVHYYLAHISAARCNHVECVMKRLDVQLACCSIERDLDASRMVGQLVHSSQNFMWSGGQAAIASQT